MSWGGDGSPQFISTTDLQLQSLLVGILYLQRLACLYRGHYHIQLCALEERLYINIVKKSVKFDPNNTIWCNPAECFPFGKNKI